MRSLERRYKRELFTALAVYVVVMLGIWPLARHVESPVGRCLVALTPVLPFAAALRAMIRHVRDSDEFQRRLHLEALAMSAAMVSFLTMTAGFLVAAKVISLNGTVLLWVFPVLSALFGLLRCWVARRYEGE
jgi:hypothetical protein